MHEQIQMHLFASIDGFFAVYNYGDAGLTIPPCVQNEEVRKTDC
jgi:hypothetical protein